jgi:hypothetical protein
MSGERATYRDGEPRNLPGASLDALEWLDAIERTFGQQMKPEAKDRLDRARTALRSHLQPHLPFVST